MQVHQYQSPRHHTFPTFTERNEYTPSYTSSTTNASTNSTSVGSTATSSSRLPQLTPGRLHKKAYTHQDPPIDEGFFSTQTSSYSSPQTMTSTSTITASATFPSAKEKSSSPHFHAKARIKPLLKLAKVSGRSSGNSIDLDQPGGGEGARSLGLGIYGNGDNIYGYDGEIEPFPRHKRNTSGQSAASGYSPAMATGGYVNKNGQYIHPRRQIPRPYTGTPTTSCHGSEDSEDESYEDDVFSPNRGYVSGEYSRKSSIDYPRSRTHPPSLRLRTESQLSSPMIRSTTSNSIHSPITPAGAMTTTNSTTLLRPSLLHNGTISGSTTRDPSPSFAASVTAARLAWDAKEASKEEKREKKRRKSEQKDREKMREDGIISRATSRGRTGSGSIWEERTEKVEPYQDEYSEKEESRGRTGRPEVNVGTGVKWGMKNTGGREYEGRRVGGRATATHPGGLKKRWLGFVVWIRIGLVKMGRKFQGIGKKRK